MNLISGLGNSKDIWDLYGTYSVQGKETLSVTEAMCIFYIKE